MNMGEAKEEFLHPSSRSFRDPKGILKICGKSETC
jgi:hypothetical protein